jgi:hypothetical protein
MARVGKGTVACFLFFITARRSLRNRTEAAGNRDPLPSSAGLKLLYVEIDDPLPAKTATGVDEEQDIFNAIDTGH